ncbi:alpha beta-hydrolase [Fusarium tjaetaba]|uniref:Alpha beta-hydrolase n=1 Tax=Fusarium tjaetaba TaxID=1567544 RepID=A0A8H5QFP7_9HYPO|nr:alpha beta-hydrolase [Fusarium tjaetaba]KAF5613642.1 alpha beta-hydrolase [Fusarium tjaetaba]
MTSDASPVISLLQSLHKEHGPEIPQILPAASKALTPFLQAHAQDIKSVRVATHQYGAHARQEVDWYTCETARHDAPIPLLVFLHGGGLTRGDKNEPMPPGGLVYANLGRFFTSKGFHVLIPNYRRVNSIDPKTGAAIAENENATFPTGGKDLAQLLKFVDTHLPFAAPGQKVKVHIIGCSAGGVHLGTYLFHPPLFPDTIHAGGYENLDISTGIFLNTPFHFNGAAPSRKPVLDAYHPPKTYPADKFSPYGLLARFDIPDPENAHKGPQIIIITAEYDPQEILKPAEDFIKLVQGKAGFVSEVIRLPSHNHISPPMTLAVGDSEGEKWGSELAQKLKARL